LFAKTSILNFILVIYYLYYSTTMNSRTIITHLLTWNPFGLKTVEFSNRLIKWLSIPRSEFKESLNRKELQYSWIYVLFWSDDNEENIAYIWQATVLWKRLKNHYDDDKKDFWNTVICFSYKDWSLTESDINFLEKELINKAKKVWRYKLFNQTTWNLNLIQEYRITDMYEFLEDLEVLILNLWYPLLKEIVSKQELENEENIYFLKTKWSNAKWIYNEEWFLVFRWSKWNKDIIPYQIKQWHILRNRTKLVDLEIIIENTDWFEFKKDYLFKTPTSACNIITWWNYNWWIEWKNKNWITLKEIERWNEL
jgi:hypothetical protein